MAILQDLGERRIISEVLASFCPESGDDCALLDLQDKTIVVTTDPVPQPAARVIGGDPDPFWAGWLLVTINVSDVAAAGATPLGFVAAVDIPANTDVDDFRRLLQGTAEACEAHNVSYVGGNIREAKEFSAVGTALGWCPRGKALGRIGARPGDLIVSVGQGGIFWRDALLARSGNSVSRSGPLFRPMAKVSAMKAVANANLVRAAMDNSDGLIPTVEQLAMANSQSAVLELDRLSVPDLGSLTVDPARLWIGWGDWNVVAVLSPADLGEAQSLAREAGTEVVPVGHFEEGPARAFLQRGSSRLPAPRVESERFAKDSWFSSGIDGYVDLLLNVPMP